MKPVSSNIKAIVLILAMTWGCVAARAQDANCCKNTSGTEVETCRPVASMFTLDLGHASILDSYLSPIRYKGEAIRIGYEAQKASSQSVTWQLDVGVDYDYTNNPAGNHTAHSLLLDARWGVMKRWKHVLKQGLTLMAGGSTQLMGGALYNSYNSNNVVSARVNWNVGLMGQAVFNTHIKRLPITIRYQVNLPVAGLFFSPDYDEAYYEIYLGNHKDLVHFGWWGNRFDMENFIAADMHLGSAILRVGYRNRIQSSWTNQINVQEATHCLVIGIGGEFVGVSHKKRANRNINSSIYQ